MSAVDIREYVAEHPFFDGLAEAYLDTIADCADIKMCGVGDTVFTQDTDASNFFIVFKGEIQVEKPALFGPPIRLDCVTSRHILGWSWLIPPYNWHFDARATTDTILIRFDGRCLRTKCEEDHSLGYDFFKRFTRLMGERLEAAREHMRNVQ